MYNLRSRPTKRNAKYTMLQNSQQSTDITIPKPRAQIIMMNVHEGIKKFGEKGNEALPEELNQLQQWDAILPMMKEDMSYEEKKKALPYLMFLKEKRGRKQECAQMGNRKENIQQNQTQVCPQFH